MTSGIYAITHPRIKGSYVGQATNFDRRWEEHRDDLANGSHHNHHLQKIAAAHGVKSLKFKVLEECDRSALDHEEMKWIAAQGTWNIRPNQQQAKAALGKGRAKKRIRVSSGIKFLFWAACGVMGYLLFGVIGFWGCVVLGGLATW